MMEPKRQRGRPAAFDRDAALQSALNLFWSHGYEGTTMAELTEALGINRPSIYGAFGNKEALFRKALQKYLSEPVAYVAASIHEPTARQVVEKFLTESAALLTSQASPRGCMVVQGALTCGKGAGLIQRELMTYRKGYEDALRQRFELARRQADLPENENPADLAKYIATVHQGMSVQASSGASKQELMAIVDRVLRHWPVNR